MCQKQVCSPMTLLVMNVACDEIHNSFLFCNLNLIPIIRGQAIN